VLECTEISTFKKKNAPKSACKEVVDPRFFSAVESTVSCFGFCLLLRLLKRRTKINTPTPIKSKTIPITIPMIAIQ
jgi:hypothetical protein